MSEKPNTNGQELPEVVELPEPAALFPHIAHPRKRAFLIAYAGCGVKAEAARLAGVDSSNLYKPTWRDDEEFQAALIAAEQVAADRIEDALYRRAVDGVLRPTGWYKGKAGGKVREFSDTAAIFLLKGMRPEKYRERLEVRGLLGRIDIRQLPDDALQRVIDGEALDAVLASLAEDTIRRVLLPGRDVSQNQAEP